MPCMDPIHYTMIPFSLPHSGTCQTPGCSFLADVIPWHVDVHHGLVWLSMLRQGPEGGQGWQTISSLRIYNAMSNTKHLKPRDHESKSMWMSRSLVLMSADDLPAGRSLAFLEWTSECVLPTTMSRCAEKLIRREKKEGIHTRVRSIFETECKAVLATYLGKHRDSSSASWSNQLVCTPWTCGWFDL